MKEANESSSEEQQASSDEEMDWNRNFPADLSIPQLDGAADENSGKQVLSKCIKCMFVLLVQGYIPIFYFADSSLTDKGPMTHSSLTATDKILATRNVFPNEAFHLETPSSAKIVFEYKCAEQRIHGESVEKHFKNKETNDCSTVLRVNKDIPYIPPVKHPIPCNIANISQIGADKIGAHRLFTDENKATGLNQSEPDGLMFENSKLVQSRKKYGSIKNVDKNHISIMENHRSFSVCYSELMNCPTNTDIELSPKHCKNSVRRSFDQIPSSAEESQPLAPQEGETGQGSKEGDVGELKIRYEDYQENKTERTIVAQQEAHYKFFPSVVLSNCLSRPVKKQIGSRTSEGCCTIEDPEQRRSRLKLTKKRSTLGQKSPLRTTATTKDEAPQLSAITPCSLNEKETDSKVNMETTDTSTVKKSESSVEDKVAIIPTRIACTKVSSLPGSKYTLRTKRKMSHDGEDGDRLSSHSVKQSLVPNEVLKDKNHIHKKRRLSKKEPPIIIKYIIINRFKGQKNMLVKIAKINADESCTVLTPEKLEEYKKFAPLKDFWPKVPESTAVKYPLPEPKVKKCPKRKAKVESTSKRVSTSPKLKCDQTRQPRRAKRAKATLTLPKLPTPYPCYNDFTDDNCTEYSDVMVELGYLSERAPSTTDSTPPRCWSPTDPLLESNSNDHLINPLNDPCFGSPYQSLTPKPHKTDRSRTGRPTTSCAASPKCKGSTAKKLVRSDSHKTWGSQKTCNRTASRTQKKHCESIERTVLGDGTSTSQKSRKLSKKTVQRTGILSTEESGNLPTSLPVDNSPIESSSDCLTPFQQPSSLKHSQEDVSCSDSQTVSTSSEKKPDHSIDVFKVFNAVSSNLQEVQIAPLNSVPSPTTKTVGHPCSVITYSKSNSRSQSLGLDDLDPTDQCKLLSDLSIQEENSRTIQHSQSTAKPSTKLRRQSTKKKDSLISLSEPADCRSYPLPSDNERIADGPNTDLGLSSIPKNGVICVQEMPSGLAVLKQLLQKRQLKAGQALQECVHVTETSTTSHPTDVSKTVKRKRPPSLTTRKPRSKLPVKSKRRQSTKCKHDDLMSLDHLSSDDSPVIMSDPGFDSCCSIEDSLSPELPDNFSFDINAIGQTEFSTLYSGNQFVLTDKNLPQKFLSDVSQEAINALVEGLGNRVQKVFEVDEDAKHGEGWHRSGTISPELFDKSSCENSKVFPNEKSLPLFDSERISNKDWGGSLDKINGLSHFQDFHCEKRDVLFDPEPFFPITSTSFADNGVSPSSDLQDGSSATPNSSPRSISSLSQLRNAVQTSKSGGTHILKPLMSPPTREEILTTLMDLDLSEATYQEPFCSDPSDAPLKPR